MSRVRVVSSICRARLCDDSNLYIHINKTDTHFSESTKKHNTHIHKHTNTFTQINKLCIVIIYNLQTNKNVKLKWSKWDEKKWFISRSYPLMHTQTIDAEFICEHSLYLGLDLSKSNIGRLSSITKRWTCTSLSGIQKNDVRVSSMNILVNRVKAF